LDELPENCPVCGKKMEKGTLRASGGRGAAILWGPPNWGWWGLKGGEKIGGGFTQVDLAGFRCVKCKIIVLSYEKGL